MHFQESTWNFQLSHVLLSFGMLLVLNPSPFLFIHGFVCIHFTTITKYTSFYLFIFLLTLLETLGLAIQDASVDGQQSSLSVILKAVCFPLQNRFSWLLGECVTNQRFKANLKIRRFVLIDQSSSGPKLAKNLPLEFSCL